MSDYGGKSFRQEAEDSSTMLGCVMLWLAAVSMMLLAILVWAC
jgi:hypothetical protein